MQDQQPKEKPSSVENQEIHDEFNEGVALARDPFNHNKLKGGTAVTTISSSWLYTKCDQCGHSFRLDDPVTISEEGIIRHNSALLPCSGSEIIEELNGLNTHDYYNGIMETFPPPKDLIVVLLSEEIEALKTWLAPPKHGFKRHECSICRHTLRPNDIVVLCPCHPENPLCRVAIHWDPFRGHDCWNAWKSNQNKLYCPVTSEKIS